MDEVEACRFMVNELLVHHFLVAPIFKFLIHTTHHSVHRLLLLSIYNPFPTSFPYLPRSALGLPLLPAPACPYPPAAPPHRGRGRPHTLK